MLNRNKTSLIVVAALLAACGGGGGSGSSAPTQNPPPPPPPPVAVFGGIWTGILTFDSSQSTEEFVGLVTEDGQFRFISVDSPKQFVGTQSTNSGTVSGSGIAITTANTETWPDGSTVTNISTDGQLGQKATFAGTWIADSGDGGSFQFAYDSEYERASSLALLEGVWSEVDDLGNPVASFTIDSLGLFTGQNASSCTSQGSFLIVDSRYNLYQINSTITGCPIAGDYSGFAVVGDLFVPNDFIVIAVDDGSRPIILGLNK